MFPIKSNDFIFPLCLNYLGDYSFNTILFIFFIESNDDIFFSFVFKVIFKGDLMPKNIYDSCVAN